MKEIDLKAGERVKVLSLFSDSVPRTIAFEVTTADGTAPDGTVEMESSMLPMMAKTRVTHPLKRENRLNKSWLQANVAVHVVSATDASLRFKSRQAAGKLLWIVVAAIGVLAIAVAFILPMVLSG